MAHLKYIRAFGVKYVCMHKYKAVSQLVQLYNIHKKKTMRLLHMLALLYRSVSLFLQLTCGTIATVVYKQGHSVFRILESICSFFDFSSGLLPTKRSMTTRESIQQGLSWIQEGRLQWDSWTIQTPPPCNCQHPIFGAGAANTHRRLPGTLGQLNCH